MDLPSSSFYAIIIVVMIMKKTAILLSIFLSLCTLFPSCAKDGQSTLPKDAVDATKYGVSSAHSGTENSQNLQALIDRLSSESGGTIYLPSGEYVFAENGTQTIGSHCIKMRSNVSLVGDGANTVLLPVGNSHYGLDMFYFNDYLDTGDAIYLENCRFENFTIDAAATSCEVYTSAGKGFMFNLFRDCHWKNVTVKNTDATGFGVDCPFESTISHCTAIHCGKAATEENGGASGFGIGFGYANGENLTITDCQALDNKKFGFFFEHQGRFNSDKYTAVNLHDFSVKNCNASGNLYNFGGIFTLNTVYENCHSTAARQHGFYFENSSDSKVQACTSANETDASFVILQSGAIAVNNIRYEACTSQNSAYGVKVIGSGTRPMSELSVQSCTFRGIKAHTVHTLGVIQSLSLTDNVADLSSNDFSANVERFENENNSWNNG